MRLASRKPTQGELDHELIWLLTGLAAGLIGLTWLKLHLPLPQCNFHRITGVACPTCGATRSTLALLRGDIGGALLINPLYVIAVAFAALYLIYAAVVVIGRRPRLRVVAMSSRFRRNFRIGLIALICVNWAWLIARGT